jgi:hypothetical protein
VGRELAIDPAVELAPEIAPVKELLLAIDPAVELARELVPVLAEREPALAAAELERALVAAVRELAPVALELEHVPVAAVLAQGHPHAQLAVALATKSVTAAHRRGLLRLAAEDLAAAAAVTTREPAVTEAVIAWEAAE